MDYYLLYKIKTNNSRYIFHYYFVHSQKYLPGDRYGCLEEINKHYEKKMKKKMIYYKMYMEFSVSPSIDSFKIYK
jgi:hypothetical protein